MSSFAARASSSLAMDGGRRGVIAASSVRSNCKAPASAAGIASPIAGVLGPSAAARAAAWRRRLHSVESWRGKGDGRG